jgi:RimJ/RimL family protein N-acetyltransferase
MEYIGGVRTDNFIRRFLHGHLHHWRVNGFGQWVFRDAADNSFVGICGFNQLPQLGGEIALGYVLSVPYWRMGLATEMARAILRVALTQHKLETLIALIHPRNSKSRIVAAHVGFHFERNIAWELKPNMLYRFRY